MLKYTYSRTLKSTYYRISQTKIYNTYFFDFSTLITSIQGNSGTPSHKEKFNVLFFGNDEISLPTAAKLYENSFSDDTLINSLGVVTTPVKNKKSTQSIFHRFIDDKRIQKYELDISSKDSLKTSWRGLRDWIREHQYNIGVIASFGKMIPGSVVTSFKYGSYVMHPSLLPKYRGAAPIQHCLMAEDSKTGISIVEASIGKFDAGDILCQKEIDVERFHRFKELSLILSHLGASSVLEFINNFDQHKKNRTPQNESCVTQAKLILDNNYVYLDFVNQSARSVINIYRAFFGSQLEPFTKAVIEGKERLLFFENLVVVTETSSIYKIQLSKLESTAKPGVIYWNLKEDRNNIYIKAKDKWLVTNKIKFDGTAYLPGETAIIKIFKNKVFEDKKQTQFSIVTSHNKNKIIQINEHKEEILNLTI